VVLTFDKNRFKHPSTGDLTFQLRLPEQPQAFSIKGAGAVGDVSVGKFELGASLSIGGQPERAAFTDVAHVHLRHEKVQDDTETDRENLLIGATVAHSTDLRVQGVPFPPTNYPSPGTRTASILASPISSSPWPPLGTTQTHAKRDEPLSATLTFVGRMTASVRDNPAPQEAPLGELKGKLELTAQRGVVFDCDTESLQALTREPDEAAKSPDAEKLPRFAPRAIVLSFAPEFRGVDGLKEKTPRLFLPKDAGKFRYLEVFAKIEVDGAVEAEFEQSDGHAHPPR
jgi:hypothetical protein